MSDEFKTYAVTYVLDGGPGEYRMQCMTVEGETTTDDFPGMIGARVFGSAKQGNERITVTKFVEQS